MGLFDKVKEMNETYKQNTKERKEKEKIEQEKKNELTKQSMIKRYDIYKGVKFKIYLPEKEIVLKDKHGGLTKGILTFTFGLPGFAGTNGIKQEKKQKTITTVVQVVDAGVIFKNSSEDGKDIRIPFEDIISFKENNGGNRIGGFTLTLIGNQILKMYISGIYQKQRKRLGSDLYYAYEHIEKAIDKKACGSQNTEEIKWSSEKNNENIVSEVKNETGSLIDELERIGNMYEKGLLTDEEYAIMKKKLMDK